jgi:tRNA-binding protein
MKPINWDDFEKVEIRVGRVLEVEDYPEARKPSYRLSIDFGKDLGIRRSVSGLAAEYRREELQGRLVVAVTNFAARQVGKHRSEVLVLAAVNRDQSLRLLQPDAQVELGARIA